MNPDKLLLLRSELDNLDKAGSYLANGEAADTLALLNRDRVFQNR